MGLISRERLLEKIEERITDAKQFGIPQFVLGLIDAKRMIEEEAEVVGANLMLNRPKVITLCGSTKFKEQFEEANERLTMDGNVVISVGVFGHAKSIQLTEQEKEMLDDVHFRKIDMADEIFVINVSGYIGQSTKREIEYATQTGKKVNYLESTMEEINNAI